MSISFSQLPTINAQYAAWQDAGNMITYFNNLINWNLTDSSSGNIKGTTAARTAARDALVAYYTAQQAALVASLNTLGVVP